MKEFKGFDPKYQKLTKSAKDRQYLKPLAERSLPEQPTQAQLQAATLLLDIAVLAGVNTVDSPEQLLRVFNHRR